MNQNFPSEDLKQRVLRAARTTPAPTRATETKRTAWLLGSALSVSAVVYLAFGGMRMTGRPVSLVVGTVAGTAALAVLAIWAVVGRGGAMAGRASSWILGTVIASPVALLAWKVFWSAQYENGLEPWSGRLGLKCLGLSLALGALPLAALLFVRRGTDPVHPGRAGMGIGVGLGLGAATLVDTWCPVAYVPHFLLGHILPLVLLGGTGLWLGRKLLAP